ncbi:MAG: exo-alpha-sialidase [Clostridiales bacterium]|nr:exo-alpha-sialidase [Clostridiales bacterium]
MKIIEAPRVIIDNPDSIFNYFAWPSVARLCDGTLAAVCSGYRMRHICPFGKAVICYSKNEGKTWTRPAAIIDTPLDDRDSGILVTKDRVFVTSFNNTAAFQRKIIGEQTGESADLIRAYINKIPNGAEEKYLGSHYVISRDGGYSFGDIHRCDITSPHGPIQTKDGRILWAGRYFNGEDKPTGVAMYELDENENFVKLCDIAPCTDEFGEGYACEPYAAELCDGRILMAIRVQRGGEHPLFTVYTCYSTDGGRSFSSPLPLIDKEAGSPPHILVHSSGDVVITYARRKDDFGIRAVISHDGGNTFGEETVITRGAPSPDLGYPSSVELSDGNILTVYYEKGGDHAEIKQVIWKI